MAVPMCAGIYVNANKTCIAFDTEHMAIHAEQTAEEFAKALVNKSATKHNLPLDVMKIKHVFLWFHPSRIAQIIEVLQDDRVIWGSKWAAMDQVEVGPPNGRFVPGTDAGTWSVAFHFSGKDTNSSTTFRKIACATPTGFSIYCAVGGKHGCIVTNDVHASNQYAAIKEWGVCAVQIL